MDSTAPGAPPFVTAENSHHEGSTSHEESYDLQGRLRGMILANGTSSSQAVSISQGNRQDPPVAPNRQEPPKSLPLPTSGQMPAASSPRRRLNQAQRRQMRDQTDIPILPSSSANTATTANTYQTRNQAPHIRLSSNDLKSSQGPSQSRGRGPMERQYQGVPQRQPSTGYRGPEYSGPQRVPDFQPRPPPLNQRLYEPGPHSVIGHTLQQRGQRPTQISWANISAQADWLTHLARNEISKAEISFAELQEKETFRLVLEVVCREVITELERCRNPTFDPASISLKSFGSLSSGFATRSSDMDLALISPNSCPDPASIESEIPRLLEKKFLDVGHGARLLTRTRVAIIKFCERPTPELLQLLREERIKWEEHKEIPVQKKQKDLPVDRQETKGNADPLRVENNLAVLGSSTTPKKTSEGNEAYSMEELVQMYELAITDGWYSEPERDLIRQFGNLVKQRPGDPTNPELIMARRGLDRLPDVLKRYRGKHGGSPARLEFPRNGVGIQCDINFSNHLALHNTLLLRCYCHCDARVRDMVLFVKAWAKRRKINSAYHGTLSSYGYVLMVLHYLVNVATPPVTPNLQKAWKPPAQGSWADALDETTVDGYDVRFWRSEQDIKNLAARGLLTNNKESIGYLLRGFFEYFGHQGPHIIRGGYSWGLDVLSLRTQGGILSKQMKGWVAAKTETTEPTVPGQVVKEIRQRYLFAIEDPFELEHNVARTVVHLGIVAIRDEFRRACHIIQSVGRVVEVEDLFKEAPERENLQRRREAPKKPTTEAKPEQLVQKDATTNTATGR